MNDSEIEAFSALMKLSRTATINLTDNQWPDAKFDKKWNNFIEYLKSFSDEENGLAEITDRKLQLLQKLVDLFFASEEKDISIIRSGSKKNIPQIIYSLNRIIVCEKPLSDRENIQYLLLLLSKIPESDYPKIAIPLLKYYLRSSKPEEELKAIIISVFSTFDSSMTIYEKDINLYVDFHYIINKFRKSGKGDTLDEVLKKIGVSERYLTTTYMKSLFFLWFFSLNRFDFELLNKNKLSIDECTSDEKKLLFAAIIYSTYIRSSNSDKDSFIRKVDELFFPTPTIDKTEEDYWRIITPHLDNENNNKLLVIAHQYYVNIFTRFIITKFFDSLSGIANDRNGKVRANFWRQYATSEAFLDVKFVVNNSQQKLFFSGLTQSERQIFAKHVILNQSNGYTQYPVFLMVFTTKIIGIPLATGHSAQIYNSDNPSAIKIINSSTVYSCNVVSLYNYSGAPMARNAVDGQGKFNQYLGWQYAFTDLLRRAGIYIGKTE